MPFQGVILLKILREYRKENNTITFCGIDEPMMPIRPFALFLIEICNSVKFLFMEIICRKPRLPKP